MVMKRMWQTMNKYKENKEKEAAENGFRNGRCTGLLRRFMSNKSKN